MTKEYDKILFRLTDILTKLSNGELPTLNELSEEYNVSVRTIQRDIYTRLNKFPIADDGDPFFRAHQKQGNRVSKSIA